MRKASTLLVGICLTLPLQAQDSPGFQLPQATKILPGPPTTASCEYVNDYIQYKWGISVRQQKPGIHAHAYIKWNFDGFLKSLSEVLPFSLSEQDTPAIHQLLRYASQHAETMIKMTQEATSRKRPFTQYGETPFVLAMQRQYESVGSYPSDQAVLGWLYALILSEVYPENVDEILKYGYEYGPAMIISGYSYASDVMAGHLLGSALLSRLHGDTEFGTLLTDAKAEARQLSGNSSTRTTSRADFEAFISPSDLPNSTVYLPQAPGELSSHFMCDLSMYRDGKYQRSLDAGKKAIEDVEYSADNFCKIYSEVLGVSISASATPAIYELLCRVHPSGNAATQGARGDYLRKRPYVYMNEPSAYPDDDDHLRDSGSYPSGHASGSWLMALVLSEVTRWHQDELLARAYQFGQGRVITGFHWQSDVDAGRMVGCAVYAFLHTSDAFLAQMQKAVKEFQTVYGGKTGVRQVEAATEKAATIYTLSGVRVEGTPSRSGIYIKGNQKIVY